MTAEIEQQRQSWCEPITPESFCGVPTRYEPEYEQLLEEIGKLESIHGEECDWPQVYKDGDILTRTKTKDMTVLGALCIASLRIHGLGRLTSAVGAYAWLVEHHSEGMFPVPKRLRGRAGAYAWFTEQLIKVIEEQKPGPGDHETVVLCLQYFNQLYNLMGQQLGQQLPRVKPITNVLQHFIEQVQAAPEPEPSPEPEPEPAAASEAESAAAPAPVPPPAPAPAPVAAPAPAPVPVAPPSAPAPAVPENIETQDQADDALGLVGDALKKLALFYLGQDDKSAMGYHLAHLNTFLGVVPDGDRSVQRPSPRVLRKMQVALEEEQWSELLGSAVEAIQAGELNLTVEYYLSQALAGLEAQAALATVDGHALGQYLTMGELADVSSEAALWLESMRSQISDAPQAAGSGATERAPTTSEQQLDQLAAEAGKKAAKKGLEAGCQVIQDELIQEARKPMRFRLRLAMATLCLEQGAPDLARPLLQDLHRELEESILNWETSLLVKVVTALLSCNMQILKGEEDPELAQETKELMALLSRVDPRAAFKVRSAGT